MLRIDADADRSRREDLKRIDVKRLLQVPQDMIDENMELIVAFDRIDEQQEFVAADAPEHVAVAQTTSDSLGELHDQRVADGVAVVVIDVLEVVDIDECQRKPRNTLVALKSLFDASLDQAAVRQARQFVEMGMTRQFTLELLAFGDIERTREQHRFRQKRAPAYAMSARCVLRSHL